MFITRLGNIKRQLNETPEFQRHSSLPTFPRGNHLLLLSYSFLCFLVYWHEAPRWPGISGSFSGTLLCLLTAVSSANRLEPGAPIQQSLTLKGWEHKFPKWASVSYGDRGQSYLSVPRPVFSTYWSQNMQYHMWPYMHHIRLYLTIEIRAKISKWT